MSSTKLSNFPNAVVTFGTVPRNELETLENNTRKLNRLAKGMSTAVKQGAGILEGPASLLASVAGLGPVVSIMLSLTGEVDRLQKKLKNLEEKLFSKLMEGKTEALNFHLRNLNDEKTSVTQKISEVVTALSHMNELLPVFADKKSIFRERYYLGAPLFANFCGILKAICLMAEALPGFNTSQLPELKKRYQEVLNWFRKKCIGRRMASCYVLPMLAAPGVEWVHDWERHFKKYEKYYEGSAKFPWMSYGEKLGGAGWRVWSSPVWYCSIVDTWDTRAHNEVKFEPLEVQLQEDSLLVLYTQRDILAVYRERVHDVMDKFFEEVSLLEQVGEDLPFVEEIKEDLPETGEVKEDFPCAEEGNENLPCTEEVGDSAVDRPTSLELSDDSSAVPSTMPCPLQSLPTDFKSAMPTPSQDLTPSLFPTPSTMTMPSPHSLLTDFQLAMNMPQLGFSPDLFPVPSAMPSILTSPTGSYPGMQMPKVGFSPEQVTTPSSTSSPAAPPPAIGFAPDMFVVPSGPAPPSSESPTCPYPTQ